MPDPITLNAQTYFEDSANSVKSQFPDINTFAIPNISKVSINVGMSANRFDNKQKSDIEDYLVKLTGQKPKPVKSRKSIASFKLRAGDLVGYAVTLRDQKAKDFILDLIYLTLPRTRDFKGIKLEAFDSNYASYSLGIENCNIFPLIGFDASVNFGMQINVVFKRSDPNNRVLLEKLNFPFQKQIEKK